MSIISDYMPHTATLHRSSGFDDYNNPTTSDVSMPCRYQNTNELFIANSGREERSNAKIFTETVVTVQDSVTFESLEFPVKKVTKHWELDGTFSHYEVWL